MNYDLISQRDFGRLEAEVESLKDLVRAQTLAMTAMAGRLDAMHTTLSEARGGWRFLMLALGAAGSLGGAISWAISHIK